MLLKLSFTNYHVWPQAFAANSICSVLFSACHAHIHWTICAVFMRWKERPLWKIRTVLTPYTSYLLTRVILETYHLCPLISCTSSQHVNSHGLTAIILHCVLQTVKDIRMCRTAAGMSKQILMFCDITLLNRTPADQTGSAVILVNTYINVYLPVWCNGSS